MRAQARPVQLLVLGFDTSCYTTSLALVDLGGGLIYEQRRPLPVAEGNKGLRQSEAFFLHMRHLPEMMEEMAAALPFSLKERLAALAVSTKPCPRLDSYMPVFQAGQAQARALASLCQVPLINTTHQEGHLMASVWSCDSPLPSGPFLACHLSGGTTEIMIVHGFAAGPAPKYDYTVLSGTLDISAGQLVDRVGQVLGLPFPAGPALEKLSEAHGQAPPPQPLPTYCRQGNVSFSGGEAWAKRAIAGLDPATIARTIEHYIAASLVKAILHHLDQANRGQEPLPGFLLLAGGVAANGYIRHVLCRRLERRIPCYFAGVTYSSDNAVGVALLGATALSSQARNLDDR